MKRQGMKLMFAVLAFALVSAASYAAGPLPPSDELLPKGFKVVEERNMGAAATINAVKGDAEEGIKIDISWQMNPMADRMIDMTAGQPEGKASEVSGLRDEPCGKERYSGGILTCRKWTRIIIGSNEPPRVSLKVSWSGAASNGLVSIGIGNAGSKVAAMKLLDPMIARITKAK